MMRLPILIMETNKMFNQLKKEFKYLCLLGSIVSGKLLMVFSELEVSLYKMSK